MKKVLSTVLDRLPYVGQLRHRIMEQGQFLAGHYHSPVPDKQDAISYVKSRNPAGIELPDIDLNTDRQFALLQEFHQFYRELPFPETQSPNCRYYYDNTWFRYADAIFLYSFLRNNKPKRIVEVGSGFTSAVILDTIEKFFPEQSEITFIDPHPDRLFSMMRAVDKDVCRVIAEPVQKVPADVFEALDSGDLLFIDSSHVVKCGSDLQLLMFDILPRLSSGVFVHFHDVFYPFEYPPEWLDQGIYWNEDYFLRAFLSYNRAWSIHFFGAYTAVAFQSYLEEKMPLCLKDSGGSIYIRKV